MVAQLEQRAIVKAKDEDDEGRYGSARERLRRDAELTWVRGVVVAHSGATDAYVRRGHRGKHWRH